MAAAPTDEGPGITLRFRADALASEAGAQALYARIVRAAAEVCPLAAGTRLAGAAVLRCRAQAIAKAVERVGDPRLAAIYAGI